MPATSATQTAGRIERLMALVNHPRTPEHERAVAQQFLNRLRAQQQANRPARRVDPTWYGAKYDRTHKLSTVEIAKLIREEIKAIRKVAAKTAQAAADGAVALSDPIGDAPASIKVGVRVPHYGSINITLSGVPAEWGWERKNDRLGNPEWKHTPALHALIDALRSLMAAYNHDNSDIMTDYFDVRFYGSVQTDWREDPRG